jgi:hypothetical protein
MTNALPGGLRRTALLPIAAGLALCLSAVPSHACPDPDLLSRLSEDVRISTIEMIEIAATADGDVDLNTCGLGHFGFVDAAPSMRIAPIPHWVDSLTVETRSVPDRCDPVMLLRDATGGWHFDDDTDTLDPRIELRERAEIDGPVQVWIGTFDGLACNVMLSVSPGVVGRSIFGTTNAMPRAPASELSDIFDLSNEMSVASADATPPPDRTIASAEASIVPTRAFLPPHQFPPDGFRGYGLLAFPALATTQDIDRHHAICSAFVASFLESGEVGATTARQFLTGWPVRSAEAADWLHDMALDDLSGDISALCRVAVSEYDLETAQHVLSIARRHGGRFPGRGPFLLAWSPSNGFGAADALVLTLDLSRVDDYDAALVFMTEWRSDIQQDFEILSNGFSLDRVRVKIRRWADAYGQGYLTFWRE